MEQVIVCGRLVQAILFDDRGARYLVVFSSPMQQRGRGPGWFLEWYYPRPGQLVACDRGLTMRVEVFETLFTEPRRVYNAWVK
jgi:hypothetical protein